MSESRSRGDVVVVGGVGGVVGGGGLISLLRTGLQSTRGNGEHGCIFGQQSWGSARQGFFF